MPSTPDVHGLLLETRSPLLRAFAQKSRNRAPLPTSAIERSIHEHDLEPIKPCPPAHAAACPRHASRALPSASDHPSRSNQPSPPDQRPRRKNPQGTSRPEHPHPFGQAPQRRASPQPNTTRTSPVTPVGQDEAGNPPPQLHERPANTLARAHLRAASPAPSRQGTGSAAPGMLSSTTSSSSRARQVFHRLSPICGLPTRAFVIPLPSLVRRDQGRTGTRAALAPPPQAKPVSG